MLPKRLQASTRTQRPEHSPVACEQNFVFKSANPYRERGSTTAVVTYCINSHSPRSSRSACDWPVEGVGKESRLLYSTHRELLHDGSTTLEK